MKKVSLFTYWIGLMTLCLLLGFLLPGLTNAFETEEPGSALNSAEVEDKWGIKPLTIRLTGAEHFLDFRYLVVNPEKASPRAGSRYFVLFTNSNKSIKRGQKVTVIMNGCRVEDLTVE